MAWMKIPEITITLQYKGAKKSELISLTSPSETADVLRKMMDTNGLIHYREEMVMLCLNQANKVIGFYRVSSGGQTGTVADVKMMAVTALNCGANQLIIAHNHPSGNLQPSSADRTLTQKAKEGLALLDIRLLDHMIITDESYYSFAYEGEM